MPKPTAAPHIANVMQSPSASSVPSPNFSPKTPDYTPYEPKTPEYDDDHDDADKTPEYDSPDEDDAAADAGYVIVDGGEAAAAAADAEDGGVGNTYDESVIDGGEAAAAVDAGDVMVDGGEAAAEQSLKVNTYDDSLVDSILLELKAREKETHTMTETENMKQTASLTRWLEESAVVERDTEEVGGKTVSEL